MSKSFVKRTVVAIDRQPEDPLPDGCMATTISRVPILGPDTMGARDIGTGGGRSIGKGRLPGETRVNKDDN